MEDPNKVFFPYFISSLIHFDQSITTTLKPYRLIGKKISAGEDLSEEHKLNTKSKLQENGLLSGTMSTAGGSTTTGGQVKDAVWPGLDANFSFQALHHGPNQQS